MEILSKVRELAALCDAMHLLIEGVYVEKDPDISHQNLSLEGGIHQLSHVLRDLSKELYKEIVDSEIAHKLPKNI